MQCNIYELFQEVEHHGLDLEMESVSASDYSKEIILRLKYHMTNLKIANHKCYEHFKVCVTFSSIHLQETQKL